MLAAPELVVAELVEMLHELDVAPELQHRIFTDRMMGGEECAEAETRHENLQGNTNGLTRPRRRVDAPECSWQFRWPESIMAG